MAEEKIMKEDKKVNVKKFINRKIKAINEMKNRAKAEANAQRVFKNK